MNSIDSHKKSGQIVYVYTPQDFWLRLDERLHEYTDMVLKLLHDYNDANDPRFSTRTYLINSLGCVYNNKLKEWHRAKIISINDDGTLDVFYIDIGAKDMGIPRHAFKLLKDCYNKISPIALHCSIDNIESPNGEWSPATIEYFSNLISGKICTFRVRSVDNDTDIIGIDLSINGLNIGAEMVKYAYALYKKKSADSLKTTASSFECPQNIEIKPGKIEQVYVSSVNGPFEIYVQPCSVHEQFEPIEIQMQEFYNNSENSSALKMKSASVGLLCMSLYTDQRWYRAIVKDVNKNESIKIFYIDYGNEEAVQLSSLRKIDEQFAKHPAVAVRCSLRKIKPNANTTKQATEIVDLLYLLFENKVKCRFYTKTDEIWQIDIKTEGNEDLAKNLVDLKFVDQIVTVVEPSPSTVKPVQNTKPSITSNMQPSPTKPTLTSVPVAKQPVQLPPSGTFTKPQSLNKNDLYEILITNVDTVNEFSVQLVKYRSELNGLREDMDAFYKQNPGQSHKLLDVDNPCAHFDDDKKAWYRALVIQKVPNEYYVIKLVDYGTVKCVHGITLKMLNPKFYEPCVHAISACLDDVPAVSNTEDYNFKFKELTLNKTFICKVVNILNQNNAQDHAKYSVSLLKGSDVISNLLSTNNPNAVVQTSFSSKKNEPENQRAIDVDHPFPVHEQPPLAPFQMQRKYPLNTNTNFTNVNNTTGTNAERTRRSYDPRESHMSDAPKPFMRQPYSPSVNFNQSKPSFSRFQQQSTQPEPIVQTSAEPVVQQEPIVQIKQATNKPVVRQEPVVEKIKQVPVEPVVHQKPVYVEPPVCQEPVVQATVECATVVRHQASDMVEQKFQDKLNEIIKTPIDEPNDLENLKKCPAGNSVVSIKKIDQIQSVDIEPAKTELKPEKKVRATKEFTGCSSLDELKIRLYWDYRLCITYFISPSEFFVQLQDPFYRFDQRFDEFQAICTTAPKLTAYDVGQICCARYKQDNLWYRAEIIAVDGDRRHADLLFVDYGNTQTKTACSDLVVLSDTFAEPKCGVWVKLAANINLARQLTASELETFENLALYKVADVNGVDLSLHDKYDWYGMFTRDHKGLYEIHIDSLLAKCFAHNLVDINEPVVGIDVPKQLTMLNYNIDNYEFDGKICHFNSLKEIYIHLGFMDKELKFVRNKLNEHLNNGDLIRLDKVCVTRKSNLTGIYCLCKYDGKDIANDKYYRAVVKSASQCDSSYVLHLIDYGRCVTVGIDQLYYMWPHFYMLHPQAVQFRLPYATSIGNAWSDDEQVKFERCLPTGRQVNINILSSFQPFLMEFTVNNQFDFGFKSIIQDRVHQLTAEHPVVPISYVDTYQVCYFKDFANVYLHSKTYAGHLHHVQRKLNEESALYNLVKSIKVGADYLVECLDTKNWYRAKVVEQTTTAYRVHYVDYGFDDRVPIGDKDTRVRLLQRKELKILPTFAYHCELVNVTDVVDRLHDRYAFVDANNIACIFDSYLKTNKSSSFSVRFTSDANPFKIELYVNDIGLDQVLADFIQSGQCRVRFDSIVTHVNDSNDFYIQKTTSGDLLDQIQPQIDQSLGLLESYATGTLCVAIYNADSLFYRARIVEHIKDKKQIKVFYIDFGNTDTVNEVEVTNMTDELKRIAPMAHRCKFYGFDDDPSLFKAFNDYFNEKIDDIVYEAEFDAFTVDTPNAQHVRMHMKAATKCIQEMFVDDTNNSRKASVWLDKHKIRSVAGSKDLMTSVYVYDDENHDAAEAIDITQPINEADHTCADEDANFGFDTWLDTPLHIRQHAMLRVGYAANNTTMMTTQNELNATATAYNNQTSEVLVLHDDTNLDDTQADEDGDAYSTACAENLQVDDESILLLTKQPEPPLIATNLVGAGDAGVPMVVMSPDVVDTISICDKSVILDQLNGKRQQQQAVYLLKPVDEEAKQSDNDDDNHDFSYRNVCISFMDSLRSFYIQKEDFELEMEKLQADIDACTKPLESTEPGTLCVAQYSLDGKYYRAKVLEWGAPKARVLFIDYGNDDYSDVEQITRMSTKLKQVPPLAQHCALWNVNNDDNEQGHNADAVVKFQALVDSSDPLAYNVKLKGKLNDTDERLVVELFSVADGVSVAQLIGIDRATNNQSQQQQQQQVLHDDTCDRQYVADQCDVWTKQVVEQTTPVVEWSDTNSIDIDSEQQEQQDQHQGADVGDHEAASDDHHDDFFFQYQFEEWSVWTCSQPNGNQTEYQFAEDTMWTSADNKQAEETQYQYLEASEWTQNQSGFDQTQAKFGDESEWKSNETLARLARQQQSNMFNDNDHDNDMDDVDNDDNNNNDNDEDYDGDISVRNTSVWSADQDVSLYDLTERKKKKWSVVEYKQEYTGQVLSVNSLNSFFVQVKKADEKLMNMKPLIDLCTDPLDINTTTHAASALCIAKNDYDEEAQRAIIIQASKDGAGKATVLFIDYGRVSTVATANLYRMSPELKRIEPLALHCCLKNVFYDKKLAFSSELIENFKVLTSRTEVCVKILLPSVNMPQAGTFSTPFVVDLFINGINIVHHLKMRPHTYQSSSSSSSVTSKPNGDKHHVNTTSTDNNYLGTITHINSVNSFYVQRLDQIKIINKLLNETNNMSMVNVTDDEDMCVAPCPDSYVVQGRQRPASLMRVRILTRPSDDSDIYEVEYVDYGFKGSVHKGQLLPINKHLSDIKSACQHYKLHLVSNYDQLASEAQNKVNNLFEFLITATATGSSLANKYRVSLSTKHAHDQTMADTLASQAVRLYDVNTNQLDLNCLIETSIIIIQQPFVCRVLTIDQASTNSKYRFDCRHCAYTKRVLAEYEKLYLKLLESEIKKKATKQATDQVLDANDLCLFLCSDVNSSTIAGFNNDESKLNLSTTGMHVAGIDGETGGQKGQSIYRVVVIDDDRNATRLSSINSGTISSSIHMYKCFNLDTGELCTVPKANLFKIDDNDNNSLSLFNELPCFAIRATLQAQQVDNVHAQKAIADSCRYSSILKMTILDHVTSISKVVKIILPTKSTTTATTTTNINKNKTDAVVQCNQQQQRQQYESSHVRHQQQQQQPIIINNVSSCCSSGGVPIGTDRLTLIQQPKAPEFYVLCHIRSYKLFYIQSNQTPYYLNLINQTHDNNNDKRQLNGNLLSTTMATTATVYMARVPNLNNNRPCRVRIVKYDDVTDECHVFCIDYGHTYERVQRKSLELYATELDWIPAQALLCTLHGLDDQTSALTVLPIKDRLMAYLVSLVRDKCMHVEFVVAVDRQHEPRPIVIHVDNTHDKTTSSTTNVNEVLLQHLVRLKRVFTDDWYMDDFKRSDIELNRFYTNVDICSATDADANLNDVVVYCTFNDWHDKFIEIDRTILEDFRLGFLTPLDPSQRDHNAVCLLVLPNMVNDQCTNKDTMKYSCFRARLLTTITAGTKLTVRLIDTNTTMQVDRQHVYEFKTEYFCIEPLCIKCELVDRRIGRSPNQLGSLFRTYLNKVDRNQLKYRFLGYNHARNSYTIDVFDIDTNRSVVDDLLNACNRGTHSGLMTANNDQASLVFDMMNGEASIVSACNADQTVIDANHLPNLNRPDMSTDTIASPSLSSTHNSSHHSSSSTNKYNNNNNKMSPVISSMKFRPIQQTTTLDTMSTTTATTTTSTTTYYMGRSLNLGDTSANALCNLPNFQAINMDVSACNQTVRHADNHRPLDEIKLEMNQDYRVCFVNLNASSGNSQAKTFTVVLSEQREHRLLFLHNLNKWYDACKTSQQVQTVDTLKIGMPCCVYSVQLMTYCRGLVTLIDRNLCRVYLVDYGQSVNIQLTMVYKLNPDYLYEKRLVFKCQLNTGTTDYHNNIDLSRLNTKLEFKITVKKIDRIPFNAKLNGTQLAALTYNLYSIRINDLKNIQTAIGSSKHQQQQSAVMGSNSQLTLTNITQHSVNDSSTEKILCSTYNSDLCGRNDLSTTNDIVHSFTSSNKHRAPQMTTPNITCIDDTMPIITTDPDNSIKKLGINAYNEDDDDNGCMSGYLSAHQMIRVRIIPQTFCPTDFFCQKLDYLKDHVQLERDMDSYYTSVSNTKATSKYLNTGDLCAVKCGQLWCRCRIMDIGKNTNIALLECIDDGRNIRTSVDQLFVLTDEFKRRMPPLAFKCKLHGFHAINYNDKFRELMMRDNVEFQCEILVAHDDYSSSYRSYEVNIYADQTNIIDILQVS